MCQCDLDFVVCLSVSVSGLETLALAAPLLTDVQAAGKSSSGFSFSAQSLNHLPNIHQCLLD